MYPESLELFSLIDDDELNKAYFTYLSFIYSDTCSDLNLKGLDITDPKHQHNDRINLDKIVLHFENAINTSQGEIFIKILMNLTKKDDIWNVLINKLKMKVLKEEDLFLNDILLDD